MKNFDWTAFSLRILVRAKLLLELIYYFTH